MFRYFVFVFLIACNDNAGGGNLFGTPDGGTTDGTMQPLKRGTIDVQLIVPGFSGIDPETLIEGSFVASNGQCEHVIDQMCEIDRCAVGASQTLASPGKLHVAFPGGSEFGWDPGAYPVHFSASSIPWAAGETIRVHNDGKDVPVFDLSTPSPSTLDAGWDGPHTNMTLTRTSPLEVTWNGAAGDVVITLRQDEYTDRQRTSISCSYTGSSGRGVIPASVLGRLAITPSTYGDLVMRTWLASTKTATVGDYAIRLRALRGYEDQYTRFKVN